MSGSGFILSYALGSSGSGGSGGGTGVELWEAASNPGVTNDDVDSAGIGHAFNPGDLWRNTATGVIWVCMSAATGAASWRINVVSVTGSPSDHEIPRFEGVTGALLQGSGVTMTDGGVLTLPSAGGVNVDTGKAVLSSTSLVLSSAMAIGATPAETKGLVLRNSSPAAGGAQQYSPAIFMAAQGWSGAASIEESWRIQVVPVNGIPHIGQLQFDYAYAGGGYANAASFRSDGLFMANGAGLYATAGNICIAGCATPVTGGGESERYGIYTYPVTTALCIESKRSSGAGNISIVLDAHVSAAINDSHVIASFAYTDAGAALQQVLKVKHKALNLAQWAVASAPAAVAGDFAYCTNGDTGAPCLAVYNGANWLRVALGTAVSAT